jgi:LmbE family N-acetylglucosaminyl deacetylase
MNLDRVMYFKKVLILSPHTDDAELGAGGTIARLLDEGKDIQYVVFSGCETSVPKGMAKDTLRKECRRAAEIMGLPPGNLTIMDYQVRMFPEKRQEILEDMIRLKHEYSPDLVLVPSSNDMHQDHGTIYWEALRAFKKEASIWGYEHPWNNLTFATDIFVRLSKANVERKIEALKAYESQITFSEKSYFDETNLRSLIFSRGAQVDVRYAEAFELVRLLY